MTRIAVFSDLHLAPGAMSRCTSTDDELLEFFDTLERTVDEVVVAGDLFDLSRPRRPLGWRAHFDAIREDRPRVVARLESYRWIWGNHDRWMRHNGVPETLEYTVDGLKVLIIHGHQFDIGIKRLRSLEAAANFVAGWAERTNLGVVSTVLHDIPGRYERKVERDMTEPLPHKAARTLCRDDDWDLVVMGHSHRLELVELPGDCVFAGTGSYCEGHRDWILIDTVASRVSALRDGALIATKACAQRRA